MLHGCIPVIIMDNVDAVFEPLLSFAEFSLRIPESELAQLPRTLLDVYNTPGRIQGMQQTLGHVWQRHAPKPVPACALCKAKTFTLMV